MGNKGQQVINAHHPIYPLSKIISPLRIGTYLKASGQDPDRALALYLWNAKMGEAFHLPIQSFEVGLRNRVSDGLAAVYGTDWWRDPAFIRDARADRKRDINLVVNRLKRKEISPDTGQIVAGLSFGFWVAMLHRRHNIQVWSSQLKKAFPHLPPQVDLRQLHTRSMKIAKLRNRISHHEPIFKRDLSSDFGECMEALGWLCPTKLSWIKPHCRVVSMIREKP